MIGAYADRHDRKPAMTLTIWLMALGSGMIGLLPSYNDIGLAAPVLLVLARLIQGFSAGGEMGPATTYLLETAPPGRIGFFGSWQLASQNLGVLISGVVGIVLALVVPDEVVNGWGWRIPFLFGIVIAPVCYYIRRNLDETLDRETAHGSVSAVLSDVLLRHWRKIVLCVFVVSGATVTQYLFVYATTHALMTLKYSARIAMSANLAFGTVFSLVGGLLADRFGLKPTALWPRAVVTILLYPALRLIVSSGCPTIFLSVLGVLMIFHAVSSVASILLIPMIFPDAVRTSGLSIAYALGVTLFGGTAQVVFTWIIDNTGDKLACVWYIIAISLLSLAGTMAIAPTAGVTRRSS